MAIYRLLQFAKVAQMDQKCDLLCAYANQFALEMAVCNFKEKDLICQQNLKMIKDKRKLHQNLLIDSDCSEHVLTQQVFILPALANQIAGIYQQAKALRQQAVCDRESESLQKDIYFDSSPKVKVQRKWKSIRKSKRQEFKLYILNIHQVNPSAARSFLQDFGIPEVQFLSWKKKYERRKKQKRLVHEVTEFAAKTPITLKAFQKMAIKVYKSLFFRASQSWCLKFIDKFHLQSYVITNRDQK